MNREELLDRLEEVGVCSFDYTDVKNKAIQRETFYITQLLTLESQLKSKDELLMEVCESIVYLSSIETGEYSRCSKCGTEFIGDRCEKHTDNCIVNKAQDYISKES